MHTILVIDDNKTNLQMVRSILEGTYAVLPALSGDMALRYVEKKKVDLILLDLFMPEMDGRDTLQALRQLPASAEVPIIFLTADNKQETEVECLRLGAVDFITKPFIPEVLKTRIQRALELEGYRKDLQGRLHEKTIELENITLQTITTIANSLDAKDEYTKGHSVRVAEYSVALARAKGWSEDDCTVLHKVALLHDVGKIGLPDGVLKKDSPLTDEEFTKVKEHTLIGANILKDITSVRYLVVGARSHHERFDGEGYPEGLKGYEIPELARIICVADAYDAMTTDRCYRPRLSREESLHRLEIEAGKQFDPELIGLFIKLVREGLLD